MLELRAYITNLGKYNEGELVGEWVTFPIGEDDEQELMERIGIDGRNYEEYFVTDYDGGVDWYEYFGQYTSIERLNEVAEEFEQWDSYEDYVEAICDEYSLEELLDSNPDDWNLLPEVCDDFDLGYYYAVEVGAVDFSRNDLLTRYFDYEAYGRDIRLEATGNYTRYGWLERIS